MDYYMASIDETIQEINELTILLDSEHISKGLYTMRREFLRQALKTLGEYELLGELDIEQINFLYSIGSTYLIQCTLSDKLQTLSSFVNLAWHKLDKVKKTECKHEFTRLISVLYKNYSVLAPKISVYRKECIARAYNTIMEE